MKTIDREPAEAVCINEAGWVVHAFQSVWLPAPLLEPDQRARLVTATTHWQVDLQFDKGLAGGRPEAIARREVPGINFALVDAFAMTIRR
jgi:hypothetical protein